MSPEIIMPYILLFIVLAGAGSGGYFYYTDTQAKLAAYAESLATAEAANKTMEETMKQIIADNQKNEKLNKQLTQNLQKAEAGLDKLRSKFANLNLTKDAIEDPHKLEEKIDRAVTKLIEKIKQETTNIPDNIRDDVAK